MKIKPDLVKLTMIGTPDVEDGDPTACYVDPLQVSALYRALGSFYKAREMLDRRKDDLGPIPQHPLVECTCVQLSNGNHFNVIETPEQVAQMVSKALIRDDF